MKAPSRVLVTGADGCVGSAIAEHLRAAGADALEEEVDDDQQSEDS